MAKPTSYLVKKRKRKRKDNKELLFKKKNALEKKGGKVEEEFRGYAYQVINASKSG